MIYPDTDEALTTIIDAVERHIAPHVYDDYAASLCRTVAQMLRSVQMRIREEPASLAADNADLRELLTAAGGQVSPDLADQIGPVLAAHPHRPGAGLDDLRSDALALRAALVAVIAAVPDSGAPVRRAARDYLRRQLDREKVWMRDAFTGPRR
jgi:hypothetical protein